MCICFDDLPPVHFAPPRVVVAPPVTYGGHVVPRAWRPWNMFMPRPVVHRPRPIINRPVYVGPGQRPSLPSHIRPAPLPGACRPLPNVRFVRR